MRGATTEEGDNSVGHRCGDQGPAYFPFVPVRDIRWVVVLAGWAGAWKTIPRTLLAMRMTAHPPGLSAYSIQAASCQGRAGMYLPLAQGAFANDHNYLHCHVQLHVVDRPVRSEIIFQPLLVPPYGTDMQHHPAPVFFFHDHPPHLPPCVRFKHDWHAVHSVALPRILICRMPMPSTHHSLWQRNEWCKKWQAPIKGSAFHVIMALPKVGASGGAPSALLLSSAARALHEAGMAPHHH